MYVNTVSAWQFRIRGKHVKMNYHMKRAFDFENNISTLGWIKIAFLKKKDF